MFYICAICMVSRSPLMTLTPTYRKILEGIVSPIIDPTPLKDTTLLLCEACNVLIQAMEKFQNTALIGLEHLLKLHKLQLDHDICPATGTEVNTKLEPDLISENTAPEETPTVLFCVKKEPEDSLVEPKDSDAQQIVPATIKEEPVAAQKMMPCIRIKKDALIKLDKSDGQKLLCRQAVGQPAVEDGWLRSRQLQLTEEVDLKPEPASEPDEPDESDEPDEPKRVYDSESTITCDEDYGDEEDYRLARVRQQSESKVALTRSPAAGGSVGCGKAAGKKGLNSKTLLRERVSWDVHSLTEAEAFAELAEARAAPAFTAAPHRCEHCALTFKNRRMLKQHEVLHDELAGPYLCNICTQRFRSARCLHAHEARHVTRYTCCRCRRASADLAFIRRHRCAPPKRPKIRRRKRVKLQSPEPGTDKSECLMCLATYKDRIQFATHYQSAHYDPARSDCYICRRTFKHTRPLPNHVREHFIMVCAGFLTMFSFTVKLMANFKCYFAQHK